MSLQHRNIVNKASAALAVSQSREGYPSERIEKTNISVLFCILSVYKYNHIKYLIFFRWQFVCNILSSKERRRRKKANCGNLFDKSVVVHRI